LPQSRDFDGGLLARWEFTLTRADALAWLRLRREWSGRAKLAFGVACLAGGGLSGLLPGSEAGLLPFLLTEALVIAAVFAGRDLWRQHRARALVPHPRPAVLEEWVDCIAGTEIDGPDEAYLSPELIGEVLLTRTHLFIRNYSTTIVVPRRAFADAAEAEAVAAHITTLSRGPYYFDAQD
jgi:hypothetical protein